MAECLVPQILSTNTSFAVGNAKIAGMSKDLSLKGLDYNNLVTFAFVGYVLFQIPIGFFRKLKQIRR